MAFPSGVARSGSSRAGLGSGAELGNAPYVVHVWSDRTHGWRAIYGIRFGPVPLWSGAVVDCFDSIT